MKLLQLTRLLTTRFYATLGSSFIESRLVTATEAAYNIPKKTTLAFSGFTPAGYPKAIPSAYAKRVEEGKKSGEKFEFNIYTGASTGDELDGVLCRTGCMKYRIPYQTHPDLRAAINKGLVDFSDIHLSHVSKFVKSGALPPIDISILEACDVTPNGQVYLTHAVGMAPVYASLAKEVYIELNQRVPTAMKGMHDIPVVESPPFTRPISIMNVKDRIGVPYVQVDPLKIKFVVKTDFADSVSEFREPDEISQKIAAHILEFILNEICKGRLPKNLLPFQSGVGNVANAVLAGIIGDKRFNKIDMYTEVLQDSIFDVIDAGKLNFASSTSLTLSPKFQDRLHKEIEHIKSLILLRPQEISNNPEVIRRLGIIAMNTALEVDIYGNVNSTHVLGTSMMNGIGGSGDFTRNAYISIFMAPSTAKNGKISTFVPMVSHVDHNEHSVQVIVSEHGLADIRGLSPRKRAELIIKTCVHPMYRNQLMDYYNDAMNNSVGKHTPHILDRALSWHSNFIKHGSMLMQ